MQQNNLIKVIYDVYLEQFAKWYDGLLKPRMHNYKQEIRLVSKPCYLLAKYETYGKTKAQDICLSH